MIKLCCDHCGKELAPLRPEWSKAELKLPKGHLHGHLCDDCQQALKEWFEGRSPAKGPYSTADTMAAPAEYTMAADDGSFAEKAPARGRKARGKAAEVESSGPEVRSRPSALAAERG